MRGVPFRYLEEIRSGESRFSGLDCKISLVRHFIIGWLVSGWSLVQPAVTHVHTNARVRKRGTWVQYQLQAKPFCQLTVLMEGKMQQKKFWSQKRLVKSYFGAEVKIISTNLRNFDHVNTLVIKYNSLLSIAVDFVLYFTSIDITAHKATSRASERQLPS